METRADGDRPRIDTLRAECSWIPFLGIREIGQIVEDPVDRTGGLDGAFVIAVYGGYFGAAAGVVLLALLLLATGDTLPRSNALKNVVLCAANVVAATLFAVLSDVRWLAVLPLSVGFFVGGTLGPAFVRRACFQLIHI